MPEPKPWYRQARFLIMLGAVVIVVVGGLIFGLVRTQAAPPQPFPFTHAPHIENGITCMFCHPGAIRGVAAGLPTLSKCQGCHANMRTDTELLQQWSQYTQEQESIAWVPVAMQPDFVYFSHQPHIGAGLNCETCHGDIGSMAAAQPQRNHNMGWCLTCHKDLAPENFVKLSDCATCHK